MRVVASVQAKRGSSRGLIHYIAHSKLDIDREPEGSRELFNAFSNELSVKSANNSIRAGIAKGRPANEELHHLVLSFRNDDYRKLCATEARRRQALKDITRAAMKSLETSTNAERLLWAAAVHRNTENPHVHIAIQKRYLTKEIERQVLKKIPLETIPHYEVRGVEKVFVQGSILEAATEKMEAIITRERMRAKLPKQAKSRESSEEIPLRETASELHRESAIRSVTERDALRKGILAEYELRYCQSKIDHLLEHGDKMRFIVSDPVSGRRSRLSLREIEQKEANQHSISPYRQIKAILHKMLTKEEAAKIQLQSEMAGTILEAHRIRAEYRKQSRKLPTPSLTKAEIDNLQDQCLETSDIRRFLYLERIRSELQRAGEIDPRSKDDLRSILAQKTVSELRSRLYEKKHAELRDRGYYRTVDPGDRSVLLAQLDREQKAPPENPVLSFLEKLKNTAARLSGRANVSEKTDETETLRNDVVKLLDEQLAGTLKDQKVEQNKARILAKVLESSAEDHQIDASYSLEQLAEIETLSVRLKLLTEYEKNWNEQRALIESAGSDYPAFRRLTKADPTADFTEHKNRIIAGRSLAREIVARVEFDKAKEDLKIFQDGKRFQKFAIADKESGSTAYFSMHDVDLPERGSLLDRAVEELFERRENRALRRTVGSLVKDMEQRLRGDVKSAKEIMASAAHDASEFKDLSFFGLRSESAHQPIFTSAEIETLELRAASTRNSKEAARLRGILESASDHALPSTTEILRDFEVSTKAPSKGRTIGRPSHEATSQIQADAAPNVGQREATTETSKARRSSDRTFQDHLR